MRTTMTMFEIP